MHTESVWIEDKYVDVTGPEDPTKQYLDAPTYLEEARSRARVNQDS
jgi:hypothetical protein